MCEFDFALPLEELEMKRDPILAAIEEYKHTWQRLETLGKEIGEFERAHPGRY